ncbi:hypothetical protein PCANC_22011 [Puccinia coronata f. sp. avenae]|uniref:Uncharacterized protein n=1 Tax=Puccinia coronata f. sp. avenae TaxID=200324 RepID=A0A2N5SFD2_9BASI|nr:hypothetical protein PCANC_22011 [Puccinia coronata f. sp. avenae]
MDKSVTTCHSAFQWVVKVSSKFDQKSLEAVEVVFALKQLPPSDVVFCQLQLANFKDDEIKFNDFLKDLEVKLSCQAKTQVQLASTARALAVSQPPTSSPGQPSLAPSPNSTPSAPQRSTGNHC